MHRNTASAVQPRMGIGFITYYDILKTFRALEINSASPVIAHASLSVFGWIHGGPQVMVGALLASFSRVIMPSFTYKTMVTPEIGPPNNALQYGNHCDANARAEIFKPDMPADRLMGVIPETLRTHPKAHRSCHPILSFTGVNTEQALNSQTFDDPLAPIRILAEQEAWVLMIGTDHRTNTSIHLAERLAGRKQFVRWAMTENGIIQCAGFPGCSEGFQAIEPDLRRRTGALRVVRLNSGEIHAIPLQILIEAVQQRLQADPLALLCDYPDCLRCEATRNSLRLPAPIPFFEANPRSETK